MHQLGGHLSNFSRLAGKGDVLIEREIEPGFRGILHILTIGREYFWGFAQEVESAAIGSPPDME